MTAMETSELIEHKRATRAGSKAAEVGGTAQAMESFEYEDL
jgi:hypothetical protein